MKMVMQERPIHVIGLELRTTNEAAFVDIPAHWKRFYLEAILDRISNKASNDVFAVYTNFENAGKNNHGTYSLIIGAEVRSLDHVPRGLVSTVIPESKRRVFEVAAGQPEKVGEKWREIWALGEMGKTYIADFECYKGSGEIEIHVGIA